MTGLAGALFAHYVRYLAPDAFDVLLSVQFVTIVFVGGLGSLRGAILGAMFVRLLPQFIAIIRDDLPFGIGRLPGLEPSLFGLVLVFVILFQPGGLNGMWLKSKQLVPGVSVQAADQLSPPEILREVGAPAMILFQAEDISVRFGGIRAVDSVSFDVHQGEVFSIIGPNGAGKTTIFNLISRIYSSTSGRLIFEGKDFTRTPAWHIAGLGIARTFQNIELFPNATLLQNLLIGRHCHSAGRLPVANWRSCPRCARPNSQHREKVEDVIAFLGLQRYRESLIANLPYGVRKVVELGRALCIEPKLLLLDEPSSGPERRRDRGHGLLDRGHQEGPRASPSSWSSTTWRWSIRCPTG